MEYPNALRRYVAALIDLAVAWTLLFAAVRIGLLIGSQEIGVALGIAAIFLTMPARIDRRAIHDLFAETIVTESAAQPG